MTAANFERGRDGVTPVSYTSLISRLHVATDPALTPRLIEAMGEKPREWEWEGTRTWDGTWDGTWHAEFSRKTTAYAAADSFALATARAACLALWPDATEEQRSCRRDNRVIAASRRRGSPLPTR